MKNLFLGLVMLLGTASFANTGDPVKELPVEPAKTLKTEKTSEVLVHNEDPKKDGLYCSVVVAGHRHTCWFCDCVAFIEALQS